MSTDWDDRYRRGSTCEVERRVELSDAGSWTTRGVGRCVEEVYSWSWSMRVSASPWNLEMVNIAETVQCGNVYDMHGDDEETAIIRCELWERREIQNPQVGEAAQYCHAMIVYLVSCTVRRCERFLWISVKKHLLSADWLFPLARFALCWLGTVHYVGMRLSNPWSLSVCLFNRRSQGTVERNRMTPSPLRLWHCPADEEPCWNFYVEIAFGQLIDYWPIFISIPSNQTTC
jgi:hypothetical protein